MKLNKQIKTSLKNFSESSCEVCEALEEMDPVVKDLDKVEFCEAKGSLVELVKMFNEVKDSVSDATISAEELDKVAENFSDNKSISRKVRLINKEFSKLEKKFKEFEDEVKKTSEISANKASDKIDVKDSVSPVVEVSEAKEVTELESVAPEVKTEDNEEEIAKMDEKVTVTNFSLLIKGKMKKLVSMFSEIKDSVENITELSEDLSDDIKEELINSDADEVEEDEVEKENFGMDNAPEKTYAVGIEITNFTEEMAKDAMEIAREALDDSAVEEIQKSFTELKESLDEVCEDYCDETAEKAIEKIEECKECIAKFSENCKFTVKKRFSKLMKNFDQIDSLIDEVSELKLAKEDVAEPSIKEQFAKFCEMIRGSEFSEEEIVEFCDQFCNATGMEVVPEQLSEANDELNKKIDELSAIEEKISNESIVNFSMKLRAKIKSMKCFSEEDLENKINLVEDHVEFLDEVADKDEVVEDADKVEEVQDEMIEDQEVVSDDAEESIEEISEDSESDSMENFSEENEEPAEEPSEDVIEDEVVEEVAEEPTEEIEDEIIEEDEDAEEVTEEVEFSEELEDAEDEMEETEEVDEVEVEDDEEVIEEEFSFEAKEEDVDLEEATSLDDAAPEESTSVLDESKSILIDDPYFNESEESELDKSIINFSNKDRVEVSTYSKIILGEF